MSKRRSFSGERHPTKPYTRYYGVPCNRGHKGERYIANHECVECDKARAREAYRRKTKCRPLFWQSFGAIGGLTS